MKTCSKINEIPERQGFLIITEHHQDNGGYGHPITTHRFIFCEDRSELSDWITKNSGSPYKVIHFKPVSISMNINIDYKD